MEAKLLPRCAVPPAPFLAAAPFWVSEAGQARRRRSATRVAVRLSHALLRRPADEHSKDVRVHQVVRTSADERLKDQTGDTAEIVHRDGWFARLAIHHLSKSIQTTIGLRNTLGGYDGLVEAARAASKNFSPIRQRELVIEALYKAFPEPLMSMIRMSLPDPKLMREFFATFTTLFFTWLVGPCEVRESEHNGLMEKNVVHIPKCRFLQESNCVGMCTNLCKFPSQAFIKDSLGMPVNMVPNFDDMSCQMVFGQEPPSPDEDPALKQPCYKMCKTKQRHSTGCTSGQHKETSNLISEERLSQTLPVPK